MTSFLPPKGADFNFMGRYGKVAELSIEFLQEEGYTFEPLYPL